MAAAVAAEEVLFDPYLVADFDPYGGGGDDEAFAAEEEGEDCIEILDEEEEQGTDELEQLDEEVAPKDLEDPGSELMQDDFVDHVADANDLRIVPEEEADPLPDEAEGAEVYEEEAQDMEEAVEEVEGEAAEVADGDVYDEALAGEEVVDQEELAYEGAEGGENLMPTEEAFEAAVEEPAADEAAYHLSAADFSHDFVQEEAVQEEAPLQETELFAQEGQEEQELACEEAYPQAEFAADLPDAMVEDPFVAEEQDADCAYEHNAGVEDAEPTRAPSEANEDELPDLGDFEADLEPMSDDDDTEPTWLRGDGLEVPDPKVADDAEVCSAFLDGLTSSDNELDMAFPQYVPNLSRYLMGHPEALVSKKKKGHKKGAGKRYFGAEERSEDVMADKVVNGCWACGKLDHESQDCVFKRCFVCSEQGHESSECRMRHIICNRCGRQGHVMENCPQEVYDDGLVNEADFSFCRCLKCGDEGHINCCEIIPDAGRFLSFQEASPSEPSIREVGRQPSDDSSSRWQQQEQWNGGGWGFDEWSGPKQFFDLAPWLLQGCGGNFGWAPPPGDGGGYGGGRNGGGGGGWRNGNSKGWGGGWNGGWGRSRSWDEGGWSSQKRRRQNY